MSQANGKPTGIPDSDAETQFAAEAMTNGRYNDTYVQSQVERRNGNRAVSRRNRRGHLCENHTGVKVPWVQRHGRKVCSHCLGKSRINTDRKRNDWYKKKYEAVVCTKSIRPSFYLTGDRDDRNQKDRNLLCGFKSGKRQRAGRVTPCAHIAKWYRKQA